MVTIEQLSLALRNADAAGDADAARVLAAEISKMQGQTVAKGGFLPLSKNAVGEIQFDSGAGILGGIKSGASLPGDVATGAFETKPTVLGQWSDEDEARTQLNELAARGRVGDLAMMGTPVNPAMRAGERMIPGVSKAVRAEKPVVPTTEELARVGGADIQAAKQSGLDIKGAAAADYSRKLQQELFEDGISPVDAPATYAKLKEIENAPPGAIFTAAKLQSLRKSLGATAQNFNPQAAQDQLAASRAIKGFDDFLPNVAEKDVLAGAPAATQALFQRGRGNYAAAQRSNDITGVLDKANTGLVERAEVRAQAANSGRNLDNTIRSKIASLLEKPKEVSGFSDAEVAALNKVSEGGAGRNSARYIANFLGGGGGLGQGFTATVGAAGGAALGGIPGALVGGAVPAATGAVLKGVANKLAKRDIRKLDEMLRKRSPLYQEREANPIMTPISPEKRAALLRALLLSNPPSEAGF